MSAISSTVIGASKIRPQRGQAWPGADGAP
jgi:hypothetical protein